MKRGVALVSVCAAALSWGTLGPVVDRLNDSGIDPVTSAFLRSLASVVILGVFGGFWRAKVTRRQAISLTAGGLGLAGFQYFYFAAVPLAGVTVSTAIAIGIAPAFTGLWTWFIARRPLSGWWQAGTLIALIGMSFVIGGVHALSAMSLSGIALAAAAAAAFAVQAIALESVDHGQPVVGTLTAMFAISALLLVPGVAIRGLGSAHIGSWQVLAFVYLGAVTSAAAYTLFARGVLVIGAPTAVTLSLLEPLGAALIAVIVLRESLTVLQWVGATLLVLSIPVIAARPAKARTERTVAAHM